MKKSKNPWLLLLRAWLLAVLVGGALASQARAQSNAIRFDTLSVEDGLSQSTVRAILQDSQGFVWFATDDGLNKYDGYTFTIYKNDPENPLTISDNTVLALFEDSQGSLWVGTNKGLDRFDRRREIFYHYENDAGDLLSLNGSAASAIAEDNLGNLWVGTTDGGLNLLDRGDNTFTHFQNYPNDLNSLVNDQITALAADPQGGLWVGTLGGLDFYDPGTNRFKHYRHSETTPFSLSSDQVLTLYFDRSNALWVGTEDGGLNRFNRDNDLFNIYRSRSGSPSSLSGNMVHAILEDSQGRLWVGGRSGLNLLERETNSFIRFQHDPNDLHSLSNDSVLAIYEDRSGVIWIGTTGGGLSKYNQTNERFTLYQHRPEIANSLSDDIIYSIYEDSQGIVWIGTMDGGLNRLNPATGTFTIYENNPSDSSSLSNNDVRAIYEDQQGNLWVGTYGGGLNRFDRDTRRFTRFQYNPLDPRSLSDDRVMAILEDQRGNLWVGTRNGGLNLMTNRETGQFIHFNNIPNDLASLGGDFVRTLYEDRSGKLWVGTYTGISVLDLDTKRFQHYQNDPNDPFSLGNDRVMTFYETPDGTMWIGTLLGGLNRFERNTRTFQRYTEKQGLSNDTVYGILGDSNGYLWLSTNLGLSRFNPVDGTFRNYDIRDGLQSNEFNAGAYAMGSQGRMYFGGVQGVNAFNPEEVKDSPIVPPVVITAFKKFNQVERKDLESGEEITLSYQDNFISFEFAALDYSTPDKNQYAYMLEGFDKEWVYSGTRRYVSYTNLKGGAYTFRVKGSNKDGVWNETGSAVTITVIPPLWERWWFIGSMAVGLVGTAAGLYLLRIRRIRFEQRILEEQVRERTQEIERRQLVAEGLREILAILNSNRTLRESLDRIIQQAVRLTGARALVIFRSGEGSLPVAVASNLPEAGIVTHETPETRRGSVMFMPEWINRPLAAGRPMIVPNLREYRINHTGLDGHRLEQYGALLAVPLLMNDVVDGGLVLVYDRAYNFSDDDLHTAQSFADHAALAIANARLRVQAEEQAVSAERSRLARDLHDAVTQTLFATSLIAEVLPRLWERSPEIGKQKVSEIRELTRGALAEMRTLLMELRPAALEDVPLADLLQQLSEAFIGRARVPVVLEADKSIQLPPNVKIGFYRIAQEALNNVSKHARASQVKIRLSDEFEGVRMEIIDDGIGFDPQVNSPDHFGLGIMEERAQSIGGSYQIESKPGKGTRIRLCWDASRSE